MTATIITIGDEILIGQVLDTNSQFLSKSLESIGISIREMLSISDDRQHILDTFARVQDKSDFVIVTGGLGPTKDDITKKVLAEYFDDVLVRDAKVLAHVEDLFEKFTGKRQPLLQTNIDQALVPSRSTVLFNEFGTAPGMWMRNGKTVFVSLPGVPFEMKAIVERTLVPKIASEFDRPYILHRTVLTYGVGESLLADRICLWEDALPSFVRLAYLPSPGRVRLRLSAKGSDKEVLESSISEQIHKLSAIIGDVIVGFEDEETLEVVIGKALTKSGQSIGIAESCTGGKIAQTLTAIPGSSAYFKGSVVCYAKEVKTQIVGVSEDTIRVHTVVSAQVASELAQNARRLFASDFGIGVTGNAGPTTDDTDKSVGVVFIAVASREHTVVKEFNFGQPREKVIDRAVVKSLEMLRELISEKK